jgi:4-carboxymuconolactone decarboxylase
MTSAAAELVLGERKHTSLSARLREVVILAVGAVWQSEYELYAHSAAARKVGLSEDAIRVLVSGGIPDDLSKDETIAAELTRQLSTTHRVDETLYRQAENAFGTTGLTDIVILIGIYHTVCATLNLFEIPTPHWKRRHDLCQEVGERLPRRNRCRTNCRLNGVGDRSESFSDALV